MRTYRTLLVTGALAAVTLGAAMTVHGDWQPALASFAGLAGAAFLLSLTRLLAIGEGPAPSAPRRRALARAAPAAKPRREAAPSAAVPPRKTERLATIEPDDRRVLTIQRPSARGSSIEAEAS